MLTREILAPIIAWLLGSIPFGYLVYGWRYGGDIRKQGSGNIGATNVMRSAGKRLGILTLLLDALKGLAAIVIADFLTYQTVDQPYMYMKTGSDVPSVHFVWIALALVLVIVGHVFTPWLDFRGGKGVATGLGALVAIAPKSMLIAIAIFVLVLMIWRYVSLASMIATALLPFIVWVQYRGAYPPSIFFAVAVVAIIVLTRHRANLNRLRSGTEPHLGQRMASAT